MYLLKPVLIIIIAVIFASCRGGVEVPMEFPTPPPLPSAKPVAKIDSKVDAELEKQIAEIATEAKGKVGVAAIVIETGEAASLNIDQQFPMQSVYKLPISMAVMDQIRLGNLELDAKVGVTKEDMVRAGQRSPLRDANPEGGEFTVRELIRLAIVESDGTASDVLMNLIGADQILYYMTQIGVRDMKVLNTEKEIGKDWETQYNNSSSPQAAVELLRVLFASTYPDGRFPTAPGDTVTALQNSVWLDMWMSNPGANRLKGLLPKSTNVAHKTGTSGTQNGITAATNDIGIVTMPNGNHFAIAVFVSDSPADEMAREAVIAKIAKACWDRWAKK